MDSTEWRRPIPLEAGFQNYAWGDTRFIPDLFGFEPNGQPFAEAWFGAHPRLPSRVQGSERVWPLDRVIADFGTELLGSAVQTRFHGLPYLVKVLAAARPLSIQVHPSVAQAQAGYAYENALGVPVTADHRNYRDQNHKPELLIALSPFFALCGFRPFAQIQQSIEGVPELARRLPRLEPTPASLEALVRDYLELDSGVRNDALAAWVERLDGRRTTLDPGSLESWVLNADAATRSGARTHDQGLFFFLLLEMFELAPGQALFLSAGIPHAYLKGAGVEVMANSDNVLRCGLTPKHTDPEELLKIVRFDAVPTEQVEASGTCVDGWRSVPAPVPEFAVEILELDAGTSCGPWKARGPALLITTNRTADVEVGHASAPVRLTHGGQACLVPDGVEYWTKAERATALVRVTVPHD